jgi:hypothetical protein
MKTNSDNIKMGTLDKIVSIDKTLGMRISSDMEEYSITFKETSFITRKLINEKEKYENKEKATSV